MCDDEINRVPQEHLGLFIANSHGMYVCMNIYIYILYKCICMASVRGACVHGIRK